MILVVSNTSPLTNLAAIGAFDVLQALYHEIHIAEAVYDELTAGGKRWPGAEEVDRSPWVRRHACATNPSMIQLLLRELDRGEAESIVLAQQLGATLILLDDAAARNVARYLGLPVIGVLGALIDAKAHGVIRDVAPLLDALRNQAGFFISPSVYDHVLRLAGEINGPG